jgi:hypothetical protein
MTYGTQLNLIKLMFIYSIEYRSVTVKAKNQVAKLEQKYKAFSIYADMSKVDRTWERYGYLKAPLAIKMQSGKFSSRSHKSQVVILNDEFRKILSASYALLPHEYIHDIIKEHVLKNFKDLGLYIDEEYTAHDEDSHYWTLLSNQFYDVDGDKIKVGVSIRNGIGTNVSLGVDLYTVREVCTNGAVMRDKNIGSFSIAHLGKIEVIAALFERSIRFAFEKIKTLIEYYKKSTLIKLNDEMATLIYKKMPYSAAYLPTSWNVLSRYEIKDLKKEGRYTEDLPLVNVTDKKQTVWEAFNQITERQRDGLRTKKINFNAVSSHQAGLHNALITIVNNNSNRRV